MPSAGHGPLVNDPGTGPVTGQVGESAPGSDPGFIGSIDGSGGGTTGSGTGPDGTVTGSTAPESGLGPDGQPGGAPTSAAGPGTTGSTATGRATWGPLTSTLSTLGISGPTFGGFALAPTLVSTTGAVAMAMAFGLFGKRRRDGQPTLPEAELAAAAAVGVGLLPLQDDEESAEAMLPRWRRPSLLQARKADPVRDATPARRLTFDQGLVGPLDGHERRLIRYRLVRMLDTPDELRGTEIGYLDRGDEVQMLQKYGAYWLVLCPDGRQGWVHNMTLGDVITQHLEPDRPVATMPLAAETWTMGDSDDDNSDVLEAYLESRRRGN